MGDLWKRARTISTDTKTALLDSAERAARNLGFDGFSYAHLAEDVGIRKASIHHHFPSKAALSVALVERYTEELRMICAEIDAAEPSANGRLTAVINRYRDALRGGKSLCLCVSLSISRESLPREVIEQIGGFRAMIINWLTAVFELGKSDGTIAAVGEPALEAAATLPLLEGAQLVARAEENPKMFDRSLQLLVLRLS